MQLQGQYGERGLAMAALLVALAVMAILMSAALPAWRHQAKREKEAELIFRGEQYVRAISLWERRNGPGSRPPSIDALVQQKFLRKKYRDPMTADGEFQLLLVGLNPQPGAVPGSGRGTAPPPPAPTPFQTGGAAGGLYGVVSKSRDTAIRVYPRPGPGIQTAAGAVATAGSPQRYSEWLFVHAGAAARPGGPGSPQPGGVGAPMPGPGRGGVGPGRGVGPGGRGVGPGGRGFGPGRRGFPSPGGPGRGSPPPN